MLEWIWRQIRFTLPPDWEMLQYSRERAAGRCAFADRYRYRFEINWKSVPGEPDFQRMMSDYASRLEQEEKMSDIEPAKIAGFHGLTGTGSTGPVSRFGLWLPAPGLLVETVFLWPDARNGELERQILRSIEFVDADADGCVPWRALGMHTRVPASFAFADCTIQPARAGFLFRGKSDAETWIFRRYGMIRDWLRKPLEDWIDEQTPADIKHRRVEYNRRGGIDRVELHGHFRPRGLLKHSGIFTSAAWIHPQDGRLYHAMLTNPRSSVFRVTGAKAEDFLSAAPEFTVVPRREARS